MDLIKELQELAEWAEANIWEVPIHLPDALRYSAEGMSRTKELKNKIKELETQISMKDKCFHEMASNHIALTTRINELREKLHACTQENRALKTGMRVNTPNAKQDTPPDTLCPANDQQAKADAGKPRLTLVPHRILFDIAAIREYGNRKYPEGGPDNWKQVEPQRYKDAAFRHFMAYLAAPHGKDPESGLPHLWHLACNIAFLCELEGCDINE